MKHSNIAIFIPHNGCPHQCSFCHQKSITGQAHQPTADEVREVLTQARRDLGERAENAEIAFFGGSFTAIDRRYMLSLLEAAREFANDFAGIRVSTRPDCIDTEVLDLLRSYHVTAVELGAQSMNDSVLALNARGHTAQDVRNACQLIRQSDISLGLQMMTGLYGSDPETDMATAEEFVTLAPDTVRVYPTVVMKQTALEALYLSGAYQPYSLEQSVSLCAKLIDLFDRHHIRLIRLGLHDSDSLRENGYCHNYHPAFKELCESKLFYDSFIEKTRLLESKNVTVTIHSRSLSKFYGQKKSNLRALESLGWHILTRFDDTLNKYEIRIGVSD